MVTAQSAYPSSTPKLNSIPFPSCPLPSPLCMEAFAGTLSQASDFCYEFFLSFKLRSFTCHKCMHQIAETTPPTLIKTDLKTPAFLLFLRLCCGWHFSEPPGSLWGPPVTGPSPGGRPLSWNRLRLRLISLPLQVRALGPQTFNCPSLANLQVCLVLCCE